MTMPAIKNFLVTSPAFIFLLTFDQLSISWGYYYKLGRDGGSLPPQGQAMGCFSVGEIGSAETLKNCKCGSNMLSWTTKAGSCPVYSLLLLQGIEVFGFQACLLLEWGVCYPAFHSGNTISICAIWPCNYLPSDLEGSLPNFLYDKKVFFWLCTRDQLHYILKGYSWCCFQWNYFLWGNGWCYLWKMVKWFMKCCLITSKSWEG